MLIYFKGFLIIVIFFLVCVSCNPIHVTPLLNQQPLDHRFANYEIQIDDIPTGWKFKGQDWSDDFGGQSHLVAYVLDDSEIVKLTKPTSIYPDGDQTNDPHEITDSVIIRLTHTVSIYPDDDQAKSAYPKWVDQWFQGYWKTWPEADFVPSNQNDTYKFECLQLPMSEHLVSCHYLQRHKHLISFVLVNFDYKFLTFAQLNNILKVVDDRLNTIELK